MAEFDLEIEVDALCTRLDALSQDQNAPAFREALAKLEEFAERGNMIAAEMVAEVLALRGPLHDAAKAYKWYYITLSNEGYSVAFNDENQMPPYYCGPVGDFRNESMVSDLVVELGFDRIHELDAEAAAWLERVR